MISVVRRASLSFAVAAVACLAIAPGANALGLTSLSAAPTSANAGAHSNFNIHIGFTSSADRVKDLTISLPPGLLGNPTATPLCTISQLQADSCPSGSQVGTISTAATVHLLNPLPVTLDMTVSGSIYNVTPTTAVDTDTPARLGVVLRPVGSSPLPLLSKIVQTSNVQLRTTTDFGLNTALVNIPNAAHALNGTLSFPIDIRSIDIHLSGTAGNGKAFMRNPTSCGTKTTRFIADSYANPSQQVTGQASFNSVNCAALPFTPTLGSWIGNAGHTAAGTKPRLLALTSQDDGEAGLKSAQVLLPPGILPDFSVLANPCSEAQFRSDTRGCPKSSIVGAAIAISPDLPSALGGALVVVAPSTPGGLPRLGVDMHGKIKFQLMGQFIAGASGLGQSFDNLPDFPISNFLFYFGYDGLVTTTRDLCQPPPLPVPWTFGGWNGATRSGSTNATVQECP